MTAGDLDVASEGSGPSPAHQVTLLGPQRRPRVDKVVAALGLKGPFATITAGWQEREPDDRELDALLGGRTANLSLWQRRQDVLERDPEYAEADGHRRAILQETQELYLLGLDHAMKATLELHGRPTRSHDVRAAAVAEAEWVLRAIDARHLQKVLAIHAEFYEIWPPHERPVIAQHRAAVAELLGAAGALVITGGHVGVVLEVLHLFNVGAALRVPVIAWSAGAMALTERVVLFHDRVAHGPTSAEVYDAGIGLVPGVVLLPAARQRLRTDNATQMGIFARRFAPAQCLVLDEGARVDVDAEGNLPANAPILGTDGQIGIRGGS